MVLSDACVCARSGTYPSEYTREMGRQTASVHHRGGDGLVDEQGGAVADLTPGSPSQDRLNGRADQCDHGLLLFVSNDGNAHDVAACNHAD